MSYSMCRFWAYDESKRLLDAGKDAPAWKLIAAGSMGSLLPYLPQFSVFWNRYASWWYCWVCWESWGYVLFCASHILSYRSCDWIFFYYFEMQRLWWSVYKGILLNLLRNASITNIVLMLFSGCVLSDSLSLLFSLPRQNDDVTTWCIDHWTCAFTGFSEILLRILSMIDFNSFVLCRWSAKKGLVL